MALLCRLLLIAAAFVLVLSVGILLRLYTLLALAAICLLAWPRLRGWAGSGWSHGTAKLADFHDLMRWKLLGGGEDALFLGRASFSGPPTRWQAVRCLFSPFVGNGRAVRMMLAAFWRGYDDSIIRVRDFVHAITFAPTGAGKGTCVQIPTLLGYRGSMVVVDPQGSLFKATAFVRETIYGHKIIRMDPLGFAGPADQSDCLNVCDFINENEDSFIDEVRSTVDLLVKREANEFQPHFNDWAIIFLSSMLSFICGVEADPAKRSLIVMRDLVCSREGFTEALEAMLLVPGVVGKMGRMLKIPMDKELSSILSTVQRHTSWMDSPPIEANLSKSTWDPRWLWSGKVTVYLILPSEKLSTLSPLMRLWLGLILRIVIRKGADESRKTLFLIDEAAHIGKIQILEDAITLMRAYGIRIWLFFQSINQLQKCYGENAKTILENAATHQFFGTNAFESADHISQRIGDCTILVESINRNRNRTQPSWQAGRDQQPGSLSTGSGTTISEAGRRVFRPEEILVLSDDTSIIFHKNRRPIASQLVPYYAAPEFKNGRMGRTRGVGLHAVLFSVVMLGFAAVVFLGVASLPGPATPPRAGFVGQPPLPQDGGVPPLPYGGFGPSPAYRAIPSRRLPRRGGYRPSPVMPPYYPAPVPGRDFSFE